MKSRRCLARGSVRVLCFDLWFPAHKGNPWLASYRAVIGKASPFSVHPHPNPEEGDNDGEVAFITFVVTPRSLCSGCHRKKEFHAVISGPLSHIN